MTLLGVVGILLGLLAWPVAVIRRTRLRMVVFSALYFAHLGASVAYYMFAQNNVTDSTGYFEDYFNFAADGFGFSTQLIYYIVQSLRGLMGGTMLDYFFLFQVFGLFGISLLMRMFEEIYAEVGTSQPVYTYVLLFLPGLHFWTSAIGKDGPLFLGICLALWGAMNVRKRYIWLALGILIVLAIRPHIGVVATAAVAATLFLDRATRFSTKAILIVAAAAGLVGAAATVQSTFQVQVADVDSVSDFLATQNEVVQDSEAAGTSAVYGSYPFRLFSLLFRPLFIDTELGFGYIASVENLVLLFIIGAMLFHIRDVISLMRRVTFIRFSLVLACAIAFLLALVYYNIGLGLRQKTMFTPALTLVFVALMAFREARRVGSNPNMVVHADHLQPSGVRPVMRLHPTKASDRWGA